MQAVSSQQATHQHLCVRHIVWILEERREPEIKVQPLSFYRSSYMAVESTEVNKIVRDCIQRNKLWSYACFILGYVFLQIDLFDFLAILPCITFLLVALKIAIHILKCSQSTQSYYCTTSCKIYKLYHYIGPFIHSPIHCAIVFIHYLHALCIS